ncbi:hypothetical protein COV20_04095 [Candidatus Woesearchaeota archaeon CG10_big_fil_rev_8_21_14_0_10_45_16]|nr:MAG: hypothetical protein COV20_04095 [Candidatus Woesearchaeota archaeon CG10_big_fil_rev_8_21_14_0_10_45_16]
MKAGIDFGSTLVKAVWKREGKYEFLSTADVPLDELARKLNEGGVTRVNRAGIGYSDDLAERFKGFEVKTVDGDPITLEKRLQVKGAKELMEDGPSNFALVSIGTGTSYTLRKWCLTIPIPIGNSLSGGFLEGIGKSLGLEDYQEMSRLASKGTPLNIYVRDALPHTEGTVVGDYVIAHFAKADKDSTPQDVLATAIDVIGATTVKDLALLSAASRLFKWTDDIVYVGSTISRFPTLRDSLTKYTAMLGRKPHFPEHGEFALAMGAYHMME